MAADPQNHSYGGRGPMVLAVIWTMAGLSTILWLLRLYGASIKAGRLRWDFFWITLGLFFAYAANAALTLGVVNGVGNHIGLLSLQNIIDLLRATFIAACLGAAAVTFSKWAIIALLIQVQGPMAKKRNYFLWGLGAVICLVSIGSVLFAVTACEPVDQQWNFIGKGNCPRRTASFNMSYAHSAVSVVSDIILALWPISIVWNLQTSRRVKWGFVLLMSLGVFTAVASLMRAVLTPTLFASLDFTYATGRWVAWANSESQLVIILGCIPPLRPLMLRLFSKVSSTIRSRTGGSDAYGKASGLNGTAGKSPGGTALGVPLRSMASRQGTVIKGDGVTRTVYLKDHAREDSEEELSPRLDPREAGITVQHEFTVEQDRRLEVDEISTDSSHRASRAV